MKMVRVTAYCTAKGSDWFAQKYFVVPEETMAYGLFLGRLCSIMTHSLNGVLEAKSQIFQWEISLYDDELTKKLPDGVRVHELTEKELKMGWKRMPIPNEPITGGN